MSQITIQCRLVASSDTRQHLWELMAGKNTPLINEMLFKVSEHSDFPSWRQKGKLPTVEVKKICDDLKISDSRFIDQPHRFYASAIQAVDYTFKSWLKIQQRTQQKLSGKLRWKEMLLSDAELCEISGNTLEEIRARATTLLAELDTKQVNSTDSLFKAYQATDDILTRCAISFLLKNGGKVRTKDENPNTFSQRRHKLEIAIQRLTEQLENRLPKGRDLTDNRFFDTLSTATDTVPVDNAEFSAWQCELLKKTSLLPFPINYESNTDLVWSQNAKGRICVYFHGLSAYKFEVYCDLRHLHYFQAFLSDQQTLRAGKHQHSSSLFILRSARLLWQPNEGQGKPWDIYHLYLACTIDTRLMTNAGTDLVRQEKAAKTLKQLDALKEKDQLTETQASRAKSLTSTLARIDNNFNRSKKPLYKGQAHISVGVSIGLENPATVAVIDTSTGKVLTYRSTRQLLGENYRLLNRQRREQYQNAHLRHKAQKQNQGIQTSDSELGQYIDRLLAKAIVDLACSYQASSIVLPKLTNLREILHTELQAKAEQKIPNYQEGQAKYTKQYRINVHRWSYSRLLEGVKSQAAQANIFIEEAQQPVRGSPQEQAKELVISAYQSRLKVAT